MFKKSMLACAALVALFGFIQMSSAELVGYWSFDEGEGDIAKDGSGYGNDGALGLSPEPLSLSRGRRVVESAWVPQVREAMKAVVSWGGTAASLSPRSFPVAMKTGTAAQWRRGYHVNYIGFGPLPDARIAFCVRITHQPGMPRAARTAPA